MLSREEMIDEAVKRMDILGLEYEGYIKPLKEDGRVMVTEMQFVDYDDRTRGNNEIIEEFPNFVSVNGSRFQIFTVAPNEETQAVIDALEAKKECLIFHVCRVELGSPENDIYAYMPVTRFEEDWEPEKEWAEDGLVYSFVTPRGFPKGPGEFVDYEECCTEECCTGCLIITNF